MTVEMVKKLEQWILFCVRGLLILYMLTVGAETSCQPFHFPTVTVEMSLDIARHPPFPGRAKIIPT